MYNLKKMIEGAKVVCFDIFDTLLLRKIDEWEKVFDIVGKKYSIYDYKIIRKEVQKLCANKSNKKDFSFDDIYKSILNKHNVSVDYKDIIKNEIQLVNNMLIENKEIKEILEYAIMHNKKIYLVSDIIYDKRDIVSLLSEHGYKNIGDIYYVDKDKELDIIENIIKNEELHIYELLYIGNIINLEKIENSNYYTYTRCTDSEKDFDIDEYEFNKGVYTFLYNKNNSFWYNLGVKVGGPIYLPLYLWLRDKVKGKKIYFNFRDGYNLYKIFKKNNEADVRLIDISYKDLLGLLYHLYLLTV